MSRFCGSLVKFGVLSHVLPPAASGQAVVLYRLLSNLAPGSYALFSRQRYDGGLGTSQEAVATRRLPARYVHLPRRGYLPEVGPGCLRRLISMTNNLLRAASQVRLLVQVARAERLRALVACTGDLADLPVGYIASRILGIPFSIYLFDDYLHQWPARRHRVFARFAEPIMARGAKAIFTPNEFLRDAYRERYGVEGVLVRNPCAEDALAAPPGPWPAREGEIRIVYTGAVYHAHFNAFRNLIAAIGRLGDPRVKLHIYTSQPESDLIAEGIVGPVVRHEHVPLVEAAAVQRNADILYLPLAFDSPVHEALQTAAPGKMGEYLATGRPILAHTPSDSFVSWYFCKHRCGAVVNRLDAGELAVALKRIISDDAERAEWSSRARRRAYLNFLPHVSQRAFSDGLR